MANPKPFFGKVLTGQVLTEGYTIDWNEEYNLKMHGSDLIIKKGMVPSVNEEKWCRNISEVEIVNEANAKNVASSIIRGTVGGVALGGVGALAGVMSAKSDSTFNVMIKYHNNQLDLIECDVRLYTKLQQEVNENISFGITDFEDIYYSEEEKKKYEEEHKDDWMMGCGCLLVIIVGVVLFFALIL